VGTQVLCSQLISSASSAVLQAYYPRVCLDILLQTYDPELDGLDSRIKFVILIFPYALSKHPSEGSLNVLRVSHDAFGAILLLRMPHLCSSHPGDSQLEQMWQSWSRALQP
jgi:hypothetical protein